MDPTPTTVFISYASEDKELATAVEDALNQLAKKTFFDVAIVRDIHSFDQGRSLKSQVLEMLQGSQILLVIYTETLKKSHSYTGFELGAFSVYMRNDIEARGCTDRRIISMFLDDPPQAEVDMLGIKLNVEAISDGHPTDRVIDPADGLGVFFRSLSDSSIRSVYELKHGSNLDNKRATELSGLLASGQAEVDDTILPALRSSLFKALSRIVERSSIEQTLLVVSWNPPSAGGEPPGDLMEGAILKALSATKNAFSIFGIQTKQTSLEWDRFVKHLAEANAAHAPFITNAFRNVVRSAIEPGPVDNEQFFVGQSNSIHRIVVTRHFSFYDGSRLMHVYFIPMFKRYEEGPEAIVLALLNVAARYRMLFLEEESPLSYRSVFVNKGDKSKFKNCIEVVLRKIFLIEDESHIYGLDEPSNYFKYYGSDADPDAVTKSFADWAEARNALVKCSTELLRENCESPKFDGLIGGWLKQYKMFLDFTLEVNVRLGSRAAQTLRDWFDPTLKASSLTAQSTRPTTGGAALTKPLE
ncbi:toll/interleukin-1 receptor domain-containing protein [Bradyrhizobium sp. th.b2]|uniref:toll/interleukin-1 receptor domain-containing protein n=1 Tax=Bradyrhizobium sp. th-b2 TaxID=172088 RepID=UPI000428768C|nr:toll/interleukin-1 receptor domain-containing protein [Bradyrhizobium sp. th.b2]